MDTTDPTQARPPLGQDILARTTAVPSIPVTIHDPDDEHAVPLFEGTLGQAGQRLVAGSYRATSNDRRGPIQGPGTVQVASDGYALFTADAPGPS